MVSANHWLISIKTNRLSWYLTLVSDNHWLSSVEINRLSWYLITLVSDNLASRNSALEWHHFAILPSYLSIKPCLEIRDLWSISWRYNDSSYVFLIFLQTVNKLQIELKKRNISVIAVEGFDKLGDVSFQMNKLKVVLKRTFFICFCPCERRFWTTMYGNTPLDLSKSYNLSMLSAQLNDFQALKVLSNNPDIMCVT